MDILHLLIIYLLLICKFNIFDRLLREKMLYTLYFSEYGVMEDVQNLVGDGRRAKPTLEFLL